MKRKIAVIEPFITAIFQDEMEHAKKYTNNRGIDWEKYLEAKSDAGFSQQRRWKFIDSREVFVLIDSLWLKPEFGLTEEKISWSLRVDDFMFHGCKVNVQLYAGSNYAINAEARAKFKEGKEAPTDARALKWVGQILNKYEPLGHGTNFKARVELVDSELIQILNQRIGFNLKYLTVIWTSHDFLFVVFHEEKNFVQA